MNATRRTRRSLLSSSLRSSVLYFLYVYLSVMTKTTVVMNAERSGRAGIMVVEGFSSTYGVVGGSTIASRRREITTTPRYFPTCIKMNDDNDNEDGNENENEIVEGSENEGNQEIDSSNNEGDEDEDANIDNDDDDENEEEDESDSMLNDDINWRVEKLRLEEANTRRFLKARPRFLPYDDCRRWVQAWGNRWESEAEWRNWIDDGEKRNSYIPACPDEYYGRLGKWQGWDHFLLESPDDDSKKSDMSDGDFQ